MSFITQEAGYWFIALFGIVMILITYFFTRWKKHNTKEGFLVAERKVSWWLGGPSIAASWIWAGALFVSIQMSYEKGLAGIFWFTLPNILALILFAIWAPKIKEKFPKGYTLPQWIKEKYKSKKTSFFISCAFLFQSNNCHYI
jgi:Na+/proline symporter